MARFGKQGKAPSASPWQRTFYVSALVAFGLVLSAVMAPEQAFAANGAAFGGNFAGIIESIEWLVRMVLLPVGIIMASAKLIYIAIVGGMFGVDPLKLIVPEGTEVSSATVTAALKDQMWGFAKGLAWVAGLFVIFEVALQIAAFLAGQVETVFGK